MDKIATNNHIVTLRKELKNAKSMVSGNLIRKIKELNEKKEKIEDETGKQKINSKIERIYSETKLINSLDTYTIAKRATLRPDKKEWEELLSNNKATPEERLTCRVILKNNIQKCIMKFRNEHKDCDEWLEEYFEFRERKKELELTAKRPKAKGKKRTNKPKKSSGSIQKSLKNRKSNRKTNKENHLISETQTNEDKT